MNVRFDKNTSEWFKHHTGEETTVVECPYCGLFYKPILGHSCDNKPDEVSMIEEYKAEEARHKRAIRDIMLKYNPHYNEEVDRR